MWATITINAITNITSPEVSGTYPCQRCLTEHKLLPRSAWDTNRQGLMLMLMQGQGYIRPFGS